MVVATARSRLWDSTTWAELGSFDADTRRVNSVAFTHDGARCVSGGASRSLRAWDIAAGRKARLFAGVRDEVGCVAISADDSLLLAGMNNGDMALWNLATGQGLHSWPAAHYNGVSGLAFALKVNTQVVVSAGDDSLKLWDFSREASYRSLGRAAAKAREDLQENLHDGPALAALAQWYQLQGVWDWAAEVLERARDQGEAVACLSLARCYWQGNRLQEADQAMELAAKRREAPDYYLRLCRQAIASQATRGKTNSNIAPATPVGAIVLQPGPADGKDIWTTSVFSMAPGGDTPGGGKHDSTLQVGGWGDLYYSLLQFNLTGCPTNAASAEVHLYCFGLAGGGLAMYLDRITQAWDWKTSGTGRDHDRLWWADRPFSEQWRLDPLPTPTPGQWYVVDITDLYNAWQSGECLNCGIKLRPVDHHNKVFNRFYSANYMEDPALRPKLVITPMN